MDWTQVLTIVGSNIALILIMFGTVIGLWLHSDKKTEDNRRELTKKIDENRIETNEIIKAIHEEMKDFHCKFFQLECEKKNKK